MKTLKIFFTVIVCTLLLSGCLYNFIVPEEVPPPPDPDIIISFAQEIEPIFNNSNNCTSCHNGGLNPNLTTGNAWTSLNSTKYINFGTPEESLIYLHPNPTSSEHSQKKYTATQAALVLGWIQQGAKNN